MADTTSPPGSGPAPMHNARLRPSLWAAAAAFVAYVVVVNGIQFVSGVPYAEFFASADNALRSAVLSLAVGCVMLLAFVTWAGWDGIWRDPGRLTMTPLMWVAPVTMLVLMVTRLVLKPIGEVPSGLLLAILATGVGVGLAEELLFRGIVLRSLRMNGRSEAWAMLIASAWFGAMHLSNAFVGSELWQAAFQAFIAAVSGCTLYQFRRATGLIVTGMVVHGLWDISTFLPAGSAADTLGIFDLVALAVMLVVGLISGIAAFVHDRRTAMTPNGPQSV